MRNNSGFTLIELLVVVAIVAVLAAIALPQFQEYRHKAHDSAARSDLRNAAVAEEAYFVNADTYISCADSNACVTNLPGLGMVSDSIELSMTGSTTSFSGTSSATRGSGTVYSWDSENGGMQ